ncbi:hypothetical protein MPLB_920009 [Mesorhizobium sp. ORS 3324]|nr:hypothetical protein MPLB_920009 [Mesorhizobium sp. ORS 3324]
MVKSLQSEKGFVLMHVVSQDRGGMH